MHSLRFPPAALNGRAPWTIALRTACAALCVALAACGGGDGDVVREPAAPPTAQPAGTAATVDTAASGRPVDVRVARSANGDGFVVWRANDGSRHSLWANRYSAAGGGWGDPVGIETSSVDIDDFDLTVDGSGNATVVWHEVRTSDDIFDAGSVHAARFDTGGSGWAAPVLLNADASGPQVASNAAGLVLAVYVERNITVHGSFYDPAAGAWQPDDRIEENRTGTGFSRGTDTLVEDDGDAIVAFHNLRTGAAIVSSNYFASRAGGWARLPADDGNGTLGGVPGSFYQGYTGAIQVAAATGGNFLLAWARSTTFDDASALDILVSRFDSAARLWSPAQTRVPGTPGRNVALQRMRGNESGKPWLLWTEYAGTRTALKALRLDEAGAACSAVQTLDEAIGGSAARADLAVDSAGAIAIWQQFEGARPNDEARSNIAISRFNEASGEWSAAVVVGSSPGGEPGTRSGPRASAAGGEALLAWIESENGADRVKVLLQSLAEPPKP